MNDKSEFEKLLKKSLADVTDILEEKSGEVDSGGYTKSYHRVLASHDDLYEDIEDVDFVHKKPGIQQKISNELKTKKFNFKHSHILDLHGFNPAQAEEQINKTNNSIPKTNPVRATLLRITIQIYIILLKVP